MRCLRAATITVADLARTRAAYETWLGYVCVEEGPLDEAIAESLDSPRSAGRRACLMRPASGTDIFLRFIEGDPHPDYRPLRSYGWTAIEICVEDVLAVNARMEKSPFKIIGPPREIDGLPAIFAMQVKGPDDEIVYLTQIRDDLPAYDLPRAKSFIDHLFILVLASADLAGALAFVQNRFGLSLGRELEIQYTMLAEAFATPPERLYRLATVTHERDVFIEVDQFPPWATPRPQHAGALPPGIAAATLMLPDFAARLEALAPWLIAPASVKPGALYAGRASATVRGPDGTLFEVMAA
jgi:catechol 2,3-dioxygenase-like lactoylglutathione lyase family enzyme